MNKYRNKKVQVDMYVFDSIAESKRYKELALLEKVGEICNWNYNQDSYYKKVLKRMVKHTEK